MRLTLRFALGRNIPDKVVSIEVEREEISPAVWRLLEPRLFNGVDEVNGCDVCLGLVSSLRSKVVPCAHGDVSDLKPFYLEVDEPTMAGLALALHADEALLKRDWDKKLMEALGLGDEGPRRI